MSCQGDEIGSEHASYIGQSVNQVYMQEDATEEERAIHQFLDACGIFGINVKNQLKDDQKSDFSVSPEKNQYWLDL